MELLRLLARVTPFLRGIGRTLPALLLLQCGTDAVGVAQCRTIENARCVAAAQCGLVDDVEGCQRFAHDHCLHGLPLEEEPGQDMSNQCAEALLRAGRCAERSGKRSEPRSCSQSWFSESRATTICQLVEQPERATQCAFLTGNSFDSRSNSRDAGTDAAGTPASTPPPPATGAAPSSPEAGADAGTGG